MRRRVIERPVAADSRRWRDGLARGIERAAPLLWALALVLIPISSFPPLTRGEGGTVGPLAAIPALLLLLSWVLPKIARGEPLPPHSTPLFAFTGVAILACAASPFLELHPFLGQSVVGRTLRAAVTLAIGLVFYLTAAVYPTTSGRLRSSMKWLAVGALPMLAWSTVQAVLTFGSGEIPWQLREFHRLLSVRDLNASRVTGFAFEPSWFADQLVILYLPIWAGALLAGYSVFRRIGGRIPVELVLLGWGLVMLIFTKSRIGLLGALAVAAVLGVFAIWRWGGRAFERRSVKRISLLAVRLTLIAGLLASLVAGVYLLGKFDPRLARIFSLPSTMAGDREATLYSVANRLAYAERVVYWASGLKIFSLHPFLGVGLGNSGFLFRAAVPVYGYSLPEIIRILNGAPGFPNPKSLWVRLLAETGIIGFLLFMAWLALVTLAAYRLARHSAAVVRTIGLAGLLSLGAQVFEGFSLDTFALPQLWIVLGLVAAATTAARRGSHASA